MLATGGAVIPPRAYAMHDGTHDGSSLRAAGLGPDDDAELERKLRTLSASLGEAAAARQLVMTPPLLSHGGGHAAPRNWRDEGERDHGHDVGDEVGHVDEVGRRESRATVSRAPAAAGARVRAGTLAV